MQGLFSMRANLNHSQSTKRKDPCIGCKKLFPALQHQILCEYVGLLHILHVQLKVHVKYYMSYLLTKLENLRTLRFYLVK